MGASLSRRVFRDMYPEVYAYFHEAIKRELERLQDQDEADLRADLERALAQLDFVSPEKQCKCGESGCITFDFADRKPYAVGTDVIGDDGSMLLLDFDEDGKLKGIERPPNQPNAMRPFVVSPL